MRGQYLAEVCEAMSSRAVDWCTSGERPEFDAAVSANPLLGVADNPSRLLVAFLAEPSAVGRLESLPQRDWAREAFALRGEVACMWCPGSVDESEFAAAVTKAAGGAVTSRNWATVLKLQALLADGGAKR